AVEGSGLGLAIAKSIVELHKGEIRAKHENGVIQFIILLPI
ncbi:two-component sensor histidine kinase, partial [Bacillus thuringiensis]|nr:two-component sensor histidine kinase [Bacillus thuringiensis]